MANNDQSNKKWIVSDEKMHELRQQLSEKMLEVFAEKNGISKEMLQIARKYALSIVFHTRGFVDFAMSIMDYLGEDYRCICKALYYELYQVALTRGVYLDGREEVEKISEDYLFNCYYKEKEEKREAERKREEEFRNNVDELQFLIDECRNSDRFKQMLDFVGRFNYLAPYNAMLVEMQLPGAKLVLTGKKWREYGRRVKPNAQQLITLFPFGPIQCMFDISGTGPIEGEEAIEEAELMKEWDECLKRVEGDIKPELLQQLINNLPSYGIYYDDSLLAANTYGGYLMPYMHNIQVKIGDELVKTTSRFMISVNHKQSDTEKFHTICHELGHLLCRHVYYNERTRRILDLKEQEFEAETVAWLVCKRMGISNPSEQYLATYAKDGKIPLCSLDLIMKAVTEIENMIRFETSIKSGKWYQADKDFKDLVDDVFKKQNRKKK
jgi:hypothetical protein